MALKNTGQASSTFDEGWWCSRGVTRLVARVGGWCGGGRPLVRAWKVHRRRAATKPRVAFIKMLNPDLLPFSLS